MLGVMEKQLESKDIPYGYALCFNEDSTCAEKSSAAYEPLADCTFSFPINN